MNVGSLCTAVIFFAAGVNFAAFIHTRNYAQLLVLGLSLGLGLIRLRHEEAA